MDPRQLSPQATGECGRIRVVRHERDMRNAARQPLDQPAVCNGDETRLHEFSIREGISRRPRLKPQRPTSVGSEDATQRFADRSNRSAWTFKGRSVARKDLRTAGRVGDCAASRDAASWATVSCSPTASLTLSATSFRPSKSRPRTSIVFGAPDLVSPQRRLQGTSHLPSGGRPTRPIASRRRLPSPAQGQATSPGWGERSPSEVDGRSSALFPPRGAPGCLTCGRFRWKTKAHRLPAKRCAHSLPRCPSARSTMPRTGHRSQGPHPLVSAAPRQVPPRENRRGDSALAV